MQRVGVLLQKNALYKFTVITVIIIIYRDATACARNSVLLYFELEVRNALAP